MKDNSDEIYDGLEPDFDIMNDGVALEIDDVMNDGVELSIVDLIDMFTTIMMFDTKNDLLIWTRNVENRIVIIIFRFETSPAQPETKIKLIIDCERNDKYRPSKNLEKYLN